MKILIVEDDLYTRDGLTEIFDLEGYTVFSAPDGLSGYELFIKESPDFVCLDIMMPGLNGYDLCRKIRSVNQNVPVLFISAKSEEIDKVVGLELGADDYIVKPFGVKEVLARVQAVYRRYQKQADNEYKIQPSEFKMADLIIIPAELRAYRNENSINLNPRDLRLLEHLYKNVNKVVSRDDLMNVGWGYDYLPNSRALDQYISALRKKIEQDSKNPQIVLTVPTAGYRYCE